MKRLIVEGNNATIRRDNTRITGIDGLRGIASLVIVIFHVLSIPLLDISDNFLFIQKYFAFGVTIFLIISAFSLFLNYNSKLVSSSSIKDYYINRYSRIAPLFIFMMLLFTVILVTEFKIHPDLREIIVNIFFLYNFIPDKHSGIIWASWTMGTLFIFYFVMPLLIIFISNIKTSIFFLGIFLLIGVSFYSFFNNNSYPPGYAYSCFFTQLPIFGFGILFYYIYKSYFINKTLALLISIIGFSSIFIIYIFLSRVFSFELKVLYDDKINNNIMQFYTIGIFLAFLVYSQCLYGLPIIDNRVTRFYGKISYSLYLLHPFVIYKLKSLYPSIYSIRGLPKDVSFFLCVIVTLIIVTPLSYLLYNIFEVRASLVLKNTLKRLFRV